MFTIFLDNAAETLWHLLRVKGVKGGIIDLTYGTGALWKWDQTIHENYWDVIKTDAIPTDETVHPMNLYEDDYTPLIDILGEPFSAAVFDPPYNIGRQSFDYSAKLKQGKLVPMQYQGKNSWGTKGTEIYTSNMKVEDFATRVDAVNRVAPTVLQEGGYLIVKLMNPRHKGEYIQHDMTTRLGLTNFKLTDFAIYIRQGATTWRSKGNLQNLNGFFLIFKKK